jgi:hypothetical protein
VPPAMIAPEGETMSSPDPREFPGQSAADSIVLLPLSDDRPAAWPAERTRSRKAPGSGETLQPSPYARHGSDALSPSGPAQAGCA